MTRCIRVSPKAAHLSGKHRLRCSATPSSNFLWWTRERSAICSSRIIIFSRPPYDVLDHLRGVLVHPAIRRSPPAAGEEMALKSGNREPRIVVVYTIHVLQRVA